jgi:hypothetical protein
MEDGKIRLGEDRKEELNTILSLIDKYRIETDTDAKNHLIKMLAVRHIVTKGLLTEEMKGMIHEDDISYVAIVDKKIREVLMPIYSQLTLMATNHLEQWFVSLQRKKGVLNPKLYKYQKRLAKFLLKAIIENERSDLIYCLLISRGAGKTYTMSMVGAFLLLFHNRYVISNSYADYLIANTCPTNQQLISFQKYYHEFIELSSSSDEEIGLIGRNEKEESLLGLYIKYKSMNRIELVKNNGGNFSGVYFRLGSENIEGIHVNLIKADEFKFMKKREPSEMRSH